MNLSGDLLDDSAPSGAFSGISFDPRHLFDDASGSSN